MFGGVIMRQSMKNRKIDPEASYVINLDDIGKNGAPIHGGTHWVSISHNCYFDSFGCPPPDEIMMKHNIKKYNSTVYQNPEDVSCGYWAITFIKMMNKLRNFEEVMGKMNGLPPRVLSEALK